MCVVACAPWVRSSIGFGLNLLGVVKELGVGSVKGVHSHSPFEQMEVRRRGQSARNARESPVRTVAVRYTTRPDCRVASYTRGMRPPPSLRAPCSLSFARLHSQPMLSKPLTIAVGWRPDVDSSLTLFAAKCPRPATLDCVVVVAIADTVQVSSKVRSRGI